MPYRSRLPRGIPAASLKHGVLPGNLVMRSRLPRGIPAASLKPSVSDLKACASWGSSAGNTRGLIEAEWGRSGLPKKRVRLPRGIPAASLKPRLTEGTSYTVAVSVFRGEYPRPH